MTLYLIRNKATGEHLSALDDKGRIRRRGHTHAILTRDGVPRLFTSERGAKYALKAWLSGVITVYSSMDMSGDDYQRWETKPHPERKASQMEIRMCKVVLS